MTARTLNEVKPEDLGDADVIVLANILRVLDPAEALHSFVERGRTPDQRGDNITPELNQQLGALFPCPFAREKHFPEEKVFLQFDVGLLLRDHPVTRILKVFKSESL